MSDIPSDGEIIDAEFREIPPEQPVEAPAEEAPTEKVKPGKTRRRKRAAPGDETTQTRTAPTDETAQTETAPTGPDLDETQQGRRAGFFPADPFFVGRKAELQAIQTALQPEARSDTVSVVVITGWDGLGKSALARQACVQMARAFDRVYWVQMDEEAQAQLAVCEGSQDIHPWPVPLKEQAQAVLDEWAKPGKRLIVLDDAAQPESVLPWLDHMVAGTRVLITSRWRAWPENPPMKVIALDSLPRTDSLRLLHRYVPRLSAANYTADLIVLAEKMNHLPLALELAARTLKANSDLEPLEMNGMLDQARRLPPLVDWLALEGADHAADLEAVFRLCYSDLDRLVRRDGLARALIEMLAWCAPGHPVPALILEAGLESAKRDNRPDLLLGWMRQQVRREHGTSTLAAVLERLADLGLVERAPGETYRIHRLVALLVREQEKERKGRRTGKGKRSREGARSGQGTRAAYSSMGKRAPHGAPGKDGKGSAKGWQSVRGWLGLGAWRAAAARGLNGHGLATHNLAALVETLVDISNNFQLEGSDNLRRALAYRPHLRQAVTWEEGEDLGLRPRLIANLAELYRQVQDRERAYTAIKRARQSTEERLGSGHADLVFYYNRQAEILKDMEDFPGEQRAYENALRITEKKHGINGAQTAHQAEMLGVALLDVGNAVGARTLLERAVHIQEKQKPLKQQALADALNHLGLAQQAAGDLNRARLSFQRSLELSETVYGMEHVKTAQRAGNLAAVLYSLGDLPGARALLERAVPILDTARLPLQAEVLRTQLDRIRAQLGRI